MKLVLEVVAPAGAGCGELDPAVATGGQQVSPVLITMEVIRASARPRHGCGHSSTSSLWTNTQPELQKHQPACDLRPKREEGHRCSVCIYIYIYSHI